jgi:hypothetical protein
MKAPLAAVLLALAAPAAAQAATLHPLEPCYVSASPEESQRETIPLRAGGFTPAAVVDVDVDGQQSEATAAADGSVAVDAVAPYQPTGVRSFRVTLTERASPANYVTAETLVSALELIVRPREARPRERVRFKLRGFTLGLPLYAHYLFEGEHRRTVSLGTPEGPCGSLKVKRRQFPMKHPKRGHWTLQADHEAVYSEGSDSPRAWLEIDVERVFKRP